MQIEQVQQSMIWKTSIGILIFFMYTTAHCFVSKHYKGIQSKDNKYLCLKQNSDELWNKINWVRNERENIKMEIVNIIQRQKECKENSKEFLTLEKQFVDLLEKEDETILEIYRLVNELIMSSNLNKSKSIIYKSYFKDT
jgi:hypothetical protein